MENVLDKREEETTPCGLRLGEPLPEEGDPRANCVFLKEPRQCGAPVPRIPAQMCQETREAKECVVEQRVVVYTCPPVSPLLSRSRPARQRRY